MKENIYDNPDFFNKYAKFNRSLNGLEAAGEWHELQRLMPGFKGKNVLDIGCGYGWHCIYAAENGASEVIGTDISEKMLEVARKKSKFPNVKYRQIAMEDLDFPDASFDVVLSSLALHYTKDIKALFKTIKKMLTKGGIFLFSAEHPIFTAEGSQNWYVSEAGEHLHWPVDRYFDEGERNAQFLGSSVKKYHHTIASYVNGLIDAGFSINRLVEPTPPDNMLKDEGMKEELRRPMMVIISASVHSKSI